MTVSPDVSMCSPFLEEAVVLFLQSALMENYVLSMAQYLLKEGLRFASTMSGALFAVIKGPVMVYLWWLAEHWVSFPLVRR